MYVDGESYLLITSEKSIFSTSVIGLAVGGTQYAELSHYENGDISSMASQLQAGSRLIVSGVYFTA